MRCEELLEKVNSWGWVAAPAYINKGGTRDKWAAPGWRTKASNDWARSQAWLTTLEDKYGYMDRIAVIPGPNSCLVIDADGPEAVQALHAFIGDQPLGSCLRYSTPGRSGGEHIIWSYPEGKLVPQRSVEPGIEIISQSNHLTHIIGPPRPEGPYVIIQEPGPGGPDEAPRWLLDKILANRDIDRTGPGGGPGGFMREVDPEWVWERGQIQKDAVEPGRDNTISGVAWYMSIRGHTLEEVMEECLKIDGVLCDPPLGESLVKYKVEYAWTKADKTRKQQKTAEQFLSRLVRK